MPFPSGVFSVQRHMRVIDIALEAELDSPEAFARAFKRAFGLSPSEFRLNRLGCHGTSGLSLTFHPKEMIL